MGPLREATLAALAAAALLALSGGPAQVPGAATAAAGAWMFARRRGLDAASAALLAAGYSTSATFQVSGPLEGLAAGALPWVLALAPGGAPRWAHLGVALLLLAALGPSGAWGEAAGGPDLVAAGAVLAAVGAGLALQRGGRGREVALVLAVALVVVVLRRGPASGWTLSLAPGAWSGAYVPALESPARAWVAAPVVLLAGAALLGGAGVGALGAAGLLAGSLALGLPGVVDLWLATPLLGEVAPVAVAPLAALGASAAAAHVLEARPPRARLGVLALAAPLVALAPPDPRPAPKPVPTDAQVALAAPLAVQPGGRLDLAGWIQGDPPDGGLVLELACGATRRVLPAQVLPAEDGRVATFALEEPLEATRLPLGAWSVSAVVEGRGGSSRRLLGSFLSGAPPVRHGDLGPWVLALAVLLAPGHGRWRWLALGAVLANAWLVGGILLPA